jgi:hypothetical protein
MFCIPLAEASAGLVTMTGFLSMEVTLGFQPVATATLVEKSPGMA